MRRVVARSRAGPGRRSAAVGSAAVELATAGAAAAGSERPPLRRSRAAGSTDRALRRLAAVAAAAMAATALAACAPGAAAQEGPPPLHPTVRVLTYNIHHGEGRDGAFDLVRLAGVIAAARPDLVALQEVDQGTDRASGVDQLGELARLTGMQAVFGPALDLPGGRYGVAVLSRWPILRWDNEPLPSSPEREPRTALTVVVQPWPGGPELRFTSTHFDNGRDSEDRLPQAAALNERLGHDDVPGILAGDFNARQDTDVLLALEGYWANTAPLQVAASGAAARDSGGGGGVGPTGGRPDGRGGPGGDGGQVGSGGADRRGGPAGLGGGAGRGGLGDPGTASGPAGNGRPGGPNRRGGGLRGDFVLYRPTAAWRVLEWRSIDETVASDHRPVLTVLEWVGQP